MLKTKTPVRAARMPIRAVSSSRISPIMMTSGSWRSIARNPSLKPMSPGIVDLALVDPGDAVLDGVFDRHHVLERRVDPLQAVVKGRGLAGADRPGDQDGPVRLGDQLVERLRLRAGHAQVGEARDVGQDLVNPDDDLLTEDRGKRRQPEVARLVVMLNRDAAVLRVLPFDDVEVGDDLEPADDRRGHRRLDEQDVLELAVDSVADPQAAFLGIEMNVGGLAVAGAFQDLVDQFRQADGGGLFLEVFADVAVMLGAIGRERRRGRGQRGSRCLGSPLSASALKRSNASWLSSSGEIRLSSRIAWRMSRLCSWL